MNSYLSSVNLVLLILRLALAEGTKVDISSGTSRRTGKHQFAAFGRSESYSESDPPPELVMSCDINEDGFNQEDALVLNLRFAEDSGEVLRSLKEQQTQISLQMDEIWGLFKETHKEQSRLLQMQNVLREQNAQLMALLSSTVRNKFSADSPGFSQDFLDIWTNSKQMLHPNEDSNQNPATNGSENAIPIAARDASEEDEELDVTSRSVIPPELPESIVGEDIFVNDQSITIKRSSDLGDTEHELLNFTCQQCAENEYCAAEVEFAQCYPCTECSPGYRMTSPCNRDNDIICEDKNECSLFGQRDTCQEAGTLCVNTPGGYLCVGGDASCIDDYYFNRRSSQCEPCSPCISLQHIIVPCSKFSDSICRTDDMEQQTDIWTGSLRKPNKLLKNIQELYDGCSLPFNDISDDNQSVAEVTKLKRKSKTHSTPSLRRDAENSIEVLRHGIIWMEYNMALLHSCRSYLQMTFLITNPEEGQDSRGAVLGRTNSRTVQEDASHKTLASTRIEHNSGDRYKFVNLASAAEIQPGQEIKVELRSPHRGCVTTPRPNDQFALHSIATNSRSGPLSLLWLSHDTGAVVFRGFTKNGRGYSSLYAEFTQEYASDLRVVQLTHNGRHFEFAEPGIILAKYHQSLYSIGDTCIEHGYSMICVLERTEGESGETLVRSQKSGVSYTDTAMSLTVLTAVNKGDRLTFDLNTPPGCQVRYMSELNLGVVNLLWVPRQSSASLLARLDHREHIVGSVKSKVLSFVETQNTSPERIFLRSSSYVEFKEAGRIYVSYGTRTIHSCDYLKAAVHYVSNVSGSTTSEEIVHQVLGDTDGKWDGMTLGVSHTVQVGSRCYVSLTCVRGRIDEMSYGEWSTLSILWLPL